MKERKEAISWSKKLEIKMYSVYNLLMDVQFQLELK